MRKGQSTLEYITIFTAIVVAILVFAYTKFRPAVERVLDQSAQEIKEEVAKFNLGGD